MRPETLLSEHTLSFAGMKKLLFGFLFLQFFYACNQEEKSSSESDLDAARNFIRSALDGDFSAARRLMITDSVNKARLDDTERTWQRMKKEDQINYQQSSITIHHVKQLADSSTVVVYSNSFKNKHDSVKVVRSGSKWLVDLKYTFGQTDSSYAQ